MAKIITQLPGGSGGGTSIHNELQGLNVGDYIHLTAAEKDRLDNISTSTTPLLREELVFSGSQLFTLINNYSQIYSIDVNGQGALASSQYTLITPNQILINDTLDVSDYLVVLYSGAEVGVLPYYTQSQTDALISNSVDGGSITKITGENISSGTAVVIWTNGLVYKYDISNINHAGIGCGISKTSALMGESLTVVFAENKLTEVGSGWSAGNSYYIGSNSLLTTISPTSGISKKIATGIGVDTIIINNYPEHILL